MTEKFIGAGLVVLLLAGAGVASYKIASHLEQRDIVVQSKERLMRVTTDSDGRASTTYTNFVYTADEAYVVGDSLWNGHFTAGTVYARLREGAHCHVTLSGYRVGLLSMYQNIIEADCQG